MTSLAIFDLTQSSGVKMDGTGVFYVQFYAMARLVMSDRQTGRDFKRTARGMDLGFGVCSNSLPTDVAFELRVLTASS